MHTNLHGFYFKQIQTNTRNTNIMMHHLNNKKTFPLTLTNKSRNEKSLDKLSTKGNKVLKNPFI